MTESPEAAAQRCPHCGAALLPGNLAVPIIGSLRFVYRAGINEVAAEVDAGLCAACGQVTLRARNPSQIIQAQRAFGLGRASPRWRLPRRSGASERGHSA